MDDIDSLLGTFCTIQNHSRPTRDEQVLAMMAIGCYAKIYSKLKN
jgi:hypothetical protein